MSDPTERLLVLASYATPTKEEAAEARALTPYWAELARLAEDNATVPLVSANLRKLGLAPPADVAARFDEISAKVRAANQARLAIGRDLLARLAAKKVPVVI